MRPATVLCALVAGSAVRVLLSALPPFRRRRLRREQVRAEGAAAAAAADTEPAPTAPSPRRRRRRPAPPPGAKCARLAEVAALLDERAPPVCAKVWLRNAPRPDEYECTFCLEPVRPVKDVFVRETPCGHVFHAPCLERWVFFTADICLDWTQYSLADDGSIDAHARPPSCPNCSADLGVLPESLVRTVVLTSVARSLSLRDLVTAAEMYDGGLVYRTSGDTMATSVAPAAPATYPAATPSIVSSSATSLANPRREEASASTVPTSYASNFPPRRDSTTSEPHLPAVAFVAPQDDVVHVLSRRSLSDELTVSRAGRRQGTSSDRAPRRRRRTPWHSRLSQTDLTATRVVLQASS